MTTSFKLNLETAGRQSDRPTLVLVHGVAGSLHIWDPVFAELSRSYRVVRLDLLGYGHSTKPRVPYRPAVHVAAIRAALRENGIAPPYVLVGLSMGATIVLEYAAEFPQDAASLIMIGYPYYASREAAKRGLRHNTWAGLTIDHPVFARLYVPFVWTLGRLDILPPRLFAGIYSPLQARETLLCPYRVFRSNIRHSMVDVDARKLVAASADMRRLFLHGQTDEWSPAGDVQSAVGGPSDTTFVTVPGIGHNLVVLAPESVIGHIRAFLEK